MTKKYVDYQTYKKIVVDIVNGYFLREGADDEFHYNAANGRINIVKVYLQYFWEDDRNESFVMDDLEDEKKFKRISEHVNAALDNEKHHDYLSFANAVKDAKETAKHYERVSREVNNTRILWSCIKAQNVKPKRLLQVIKPKNFMKKILKKRESALKKSL